MGSKIGEGIRSPNITVENIYFDTTPLNMFKGMVTEECIVSYSEVRTKYHQ